MFYKWPEVPFNSAKGGVLMTGFVPSLVGKIGLFECRFVTQMSLVLHWDRMCVHGMLRNPFNKSG